MLKYMRNKLVSVAKKEDDTLAVHGVLDDDIYSIELDLLIGMAGVEILTIDGKWHRWTTPECPRAVGFLQEAVGFKMEDEGFSQSVHKIVGRKACRHFANLLLECCHTAREAIRVVRYQEARLEKEGIPFEAYIEGETEKKAPPGSSPAVPEEKVASNEPAASARPMEMKKPDGDGMVIDLHVHTSPASPCSSASVDGLIEEAKRIGLDGICLTDHNYVWDPAAIQELNRRHGFLVLMGNEITTDQGDMVVFGLHKDIQGIIKLDALRKEVEEAGGFMIVAHPFRGFLTFGVGQLGLTPEKAMERPLFTMVDAVEILNGKVTPKENSFAAEVAAGLGLPQTGGSDAHEVAEVGIYATRFSKGVRIRNEKDLIAALKSGAYSALAYRKEKGL
jgi:predicted metal-dependent phosphoesterase TrpH